MYFTYWYLSWKFTSLFTDWENLYSIWVSEKIRRCEPGLVWGAEQFAVATFRRWPFADTAIRRRGVSPISVSPTSGSPHGGLPFPRLQFIIASWLTYPPAVYYYVYWRRSWYAMQETSNITIKSLFRRSHRDGHVWLMQSEVQTTTRGFLAVSAGALEIANVIQGALEVFCFSHGSVSVF